MTAQPQDTQAVQPEVKQNDKEHNFRMLEAKYQRQLEQEREARLQAEKMAQEALAKHTRTQEAEAEDDSDPYVDHKKLDKKLARFGEQAKQQTQADINKAVQQAISEERRQNWLKTNPDFYQVLENADKFAAKDPELAEAILQMPEGFERQKLVYKNIKALGLHLPEQKESSIQDKIDRNRSTPYYQPSGMASAPYSNQGDFSKDGQKNAYDKMKELQKRMRS